MTVGFPRARAGVTLDSRFRGNDGLAGMAVGFPYARAGGAHTTPQRNGECMLVSG